MDGNVLLLMEINQPKLLLFQLLCARMKFFHAILIFSVQFLNSSVIHYTTHQHAQHASHTLCKEDGSGSCSVTRPFLSAKGMACETTWPMARKLTAGYFAVWILSKTGI